MSEPPPADGRRKLSPFDATLLVMGGIIGVGIFFTPHTVDQRVHAPWAFLAVWIFGGGIALCAAFTFAELGGSLPREGGWFVYIREAFGDFWSFLFAWVVLFVVSTGAMAAILSFAADMLHAGAPALVGPPGSPSHRSVPVVVVLGLTAVSLLGAKSGARFQNGCMITKLTVIAGLVVVGVAAALGDGGVEAAGAAVGAGAGDGAAGAADAATPDGPLAGMLASLTPVFFSYGGWQLLCYIAPEMRDPARQLPRAILVGVSSVLLVYVVANGAFVAALGLEGLAGDPAFATHLAGSALGVTGERLLALGMAVSAVGVCAVNVLTGPWLYVAMAREGLFFRSIGRVHPARGVPVNALLLQAALVLVYVFIDTLQDLVDAVVFVEWIFHALAALALIRLRRARPELPRPFRAPWHPFTPAVYFVAALLVLGGTLWQAPPEVTLRGLGITLLGALVYRPWRRVVAG